MHSLFADWHRLVEIEPRAEDLESRWGVIDAMPPNLSAEQIVSVVAVAHGSVPTQEGFLESFAQSFKEADSTFPMVGNEALLSVLAAASAINLFARKDVKSDLSAYCVVANQAVGRSAAVAELGAEANAYLVAEGTRQREVQNSPAPIKATIPKALKDAVDAATNASNPELVDFAAFGVAVNQLVATIYGAANTAVMESVKLARLVVSPLREEIDMLWWLISGHSKTADRSWRELESGAAAVAGGWELASMVTVMPGPPVSTELLRQLLTITFGDSSTLVAHATAIEGLPDGMLIPELVEEIIDLTPLCALATGRQAGSGLTEPQVLIDIACQAFTEALLVRAYEAAS
jgi:hypothetical protein